MSQQSLFTSVTLANANSANTYVNLGFTPGLIQLTNLSAMQASPHVAAHGYYAYWQFGMAQGTAINNTFLATSFSAVPNYVATNGITLLNQLGSEQGQFGAVISAITNASPGVLTVDSTLNAGITAGDVIRIALVANDFTGPTLNGDYYVASVTSTTITLGTAPAGTWPKTLTSPNTTSSGVYISGGVVTVLQNANATTPNPPYSIYSNVPNWFNEAFQGFIIGTNVFPNAGTNDVILVSAWDMMQP